MLISSAQSKPIRSILIIALLYPSHFPAACCMVLYQSHVHQSQQALTTLHRSPYRLREDSLQLSNQAYRSAVSQFGNPTRPNILVSWMPGNRCHG